MHPHLMSALADAHLDDLRASAGAAPLRNRAGTLRGIVRRYFADARRRDVRVGDRSRRLVGLSAR